MLFIWLAVRAWTRHFRALDHGFRALTRHFRALDHGFRAWTN
ncbi:hypothetical protein [Sporolactobacillus nakayamae]|nr:hypothetical protein [Sporolactobacillus nakayamae]